MPDAIETPFHAKMNAIARALDDVFNADGGHSTGFVLLVFPFDSPDGRCNYISNGADRDDIVKLFGDVIERFEDEK